MTWSTFVAKSIEHVLQNKGSRTPGVDGKTRTDYHSAEARLKWQHEIVQALRTNTYRPAPVRRIYIDKPNKPGEKRPLGIPPLVDRCVQDMLRRVLEPVYEGIFHPHSYGFRPFRSAHYAIERIRQLILCGYTWVIEGDIKGYFDHVDHDILMRLVQRKVGDRQVLRLIRAFLKAGIMEGGTRLPSDEGTPQGGILSPLLANIYLNELDWFVADRFESLTLPQRRKAPFGCFICRYADDFVVLVRGTRDQAEALKAEIASYLGQNLKLQLSEEKTLVTHVDNGFDFLGFRIQRFNRGGRRLVLASPSQKAQTKFQRRIGELTQEISRHGGSLWILDLNEYLAGWAEYFRWANSKNTFSKLDNQVWWIIALRMRGRWRRSRSKKGLKAFLRAQLVPYRFDAQHPRYKRFTKKNFGHWIDDSKTAAFIVDSLSYHPIRYSPLCTQANPYTAGGRRRLEGLKRSRKVTTTTWPLPPNEKSEGPKTYALLQQRIVQQGSRCTTCNKALDRADLERCLQRMAQKLYAVRDRTVHIQCITCSNSGKH